MPMVTNVCVYRDEPALSQPVLMYANAQALRTLSFSYMKVSGGSLKQGQQISMHQACRITEGPYSANNRGVIKTCSRIGIVDGSNPPQVEFEFT